MNKVAGLEVNVEGLYELRLELGLNRLQVPHIITSFKRFWVWEKGSRRGRTVRKHLNTPQIHLQTHGLTDTSDTLNILEILDTLDTLNTLNTFDHFDLLKKN